MRPTPRSGCCTLLYLLPAPVRPQRPADLQYLRQTPRLGRSVEPARPCLALSAPDADPGPRCVLGVPQPDGGDGGLELCLRLLPGGDTAGVGRVRSGRSAGASQILRRLTESQ